MLKTLDKDELINEIYMRSYSRNYFLSEFLKDDIDYIVSCLKASLGNYMILKHKEWDKQTSSSAAFRKYLNYNGQYKNFKIYMREDVIYFIEENIKDTRWHKDIYTSMTKYFIQILHNKTIYYELDDSNLRWDLKRYRQMYLDCRKQANDNIKNEKELIYKALHKAFENVDMSLDNKQIVKYINQSIRWFFGNETHKLPDWYAHTKKEMHQRVGSSNISNKRVFILNEWFGLNIMFNADIEKLDFFTKSQKDFIVDVLEIVKENTSIGYKKNKKGEWDLSKKQIADIMGLTINAFNKKIRRIKEKSLANGIVVENNRFKKDNVIEYKFKAIDRKTMIEDMYIGTDERETYLVSLQDEYTRYMYENYL